MLLKCLNKKYLDPEIMKQISIQTLYNDGIGSSKNIHRTESLYNVNLLKTENY